MELVGGGSLINGPTPFFLLFNKLQHKTRCIQSLIQIIVKNTLGAPRHLTLVPERQSSLASVNQCKGHSDNFDFLDM